MDVSVNGCSLEIVELQERTESLPVFIVDKLFILPSRFVKYVMTAAARCVPNLVCLYPADG